MDEATFRKAILILEALEIEVDLLAANIKAGRRQLEDQYLRITNPDGFIRHEIKALRLQKAL